MSRIKHALFIALFLVLVFGAAHAQAPTAGIVNSSANVRSGPGTNNAIVGSLPVGAAVEITGCNTECDWYQIGPDRWIAAFLVDATAAPQPTEAASATALPSAPAVALPVTGTMEVHFLDVDQGDSILLEGPDFTILIDAGRHDRNDVVAQLQEYGVQSIDLFVGTHPHADHIGQVPSVFDAFPVTDVWLSGDLATTATFERAIDAIDAEDVGYAEPRAGEVYNIGSARLEILNPSHLDHDDVNDGSIVIRLVFGDVAMLFTGDAEAVAEGEMLDSGRNLQAQILKVGHHGSSSSSTLEFLEAVNPEIAVWSAGQDNSFGHPHASTINRLTQLGIETHGTATEGAITICTDGQTYKIGACETPSGTASSPITTTAPTAVPTAMPTVAPTARPTTAPTPAFSSDEQEYINFLLDITTNYSEAFQVLSEQFMEAGQDITRLATEEWILKTAAAVAVIQLANEEIRSQTVPPRFAAVHAEMLVAASHYDEAIDLIVEGIDSFDVDKIVVGQTSMLEGNNAIQRANAAMQTATAAVTPTATSAPACPTANTNANLRAGPGTTNAVVGRASQGTCLTITGRTEAGDWYLLEGGNWIAASLVDNAPPMTGISVISAPAPTTAPPTTAPPTTAPPTTAPPTTAPPTTSPPTTAPSTATVTQPTPIPPTATPVPPLTNTPSCDPNYAGACIPIVDHDLNCPEVGATNFQSVGSDPHGFDRDNDGIACER